MCNTYTAQPSGPVGKSNADQANLDYRKVRGYDSLPSNIRAVLRAVGMLVKFQSFTRSRLLFTAFPILALMADLISFPRFFENRPAIRSVNLMSLLANRQTSLGIFKAHKVYVSVDDLTASDSLFRMRNSRNGLVISGFIDDGHIKMAALGYGALKKLRSVSQAEYDTVFEQLSQTTYLSPGEVLETTIQLSAGERDVFPVDSIYTALFTAGQPIDTHELGKAISKVLAAAKEEKIRVLIVPCLGRNWEHANDANALGFADFFSTFFSSLESTSPSPEIDLSLYSEWPSFELERAVGELNSSWNAVAFPKALQQRDFLYRGTVRWTMLSWFLCLLVCSYRIVPGFWKFVFISTSYLALTLGSDKFVGFLAQGYSSLNVLLNYLVPVGLAFVFPTIVGFDLKKLFEPKNVHKGRGSKDER